MKKVDVESAGMTDPGRARSENQDQFFAGEIASSMSSVSSSLTLPKKSRLLSGTTAHVFMVADGMGGHRAGKEASQITLEYFVTAILNNVHRVLVDDELTEITFEESLKRMLIDAHQMIRGRSQQHAELEGMGTTLTLSYVCWPTMFIAHAGDTRCYLLRSDAFELITRDHTVANEMMRSGQLAPESLERSPWSNVLVNALGAGADEVRPDIYRIELQSGDRILLCSDGLNKHVTDPQIQQCLMKSQSSTAACQGLIDLANQGGGSDNITVVVAKFTSSQQTQTLKTLSTPEGEVTPCFDFDEPELNDPDSTIDDIKDTADFLDKTSETLDFDNP